MAGRGAGRTLFLAAALGGVAAPALALPADFKAKADAYVESAWPADGPGASVIVVEKGKTVYVRGRGLADVEARTPITPDTVFRLGSITKQFSAAVILQLVDEGKLSLDDPISKFIPDYPKPGASATVRQLLNHTVGVQSYTGIPGFMASDEKVGRAYTTAEMIALFRDMPMISAPGERHQYNNSGYVLVGAVIEAVTGKPWHRAVEERIARPLRLATIRYGIEEAATPRMAKGYSLADDRVKPARILHMSVPHAAGALLGNVRDLGKWGYALHHGKVVGPARYAEMVAPTILPGGESVPYGFGLGRAKVRGSDGIGHGGGIFGFSTDSVYLSDRDIFVAVLTNSDQPATYPGIAVQRLAALAAGDPYPEFETAAADPASVEPVLGLYKVEGDDADRLFHVRDGKYYTRRKGGSDQEVFPAGGDRFHYGRNSLTWFELKRAPDGTHVMEMHQNGAHAAEKAVRSGPVPPRPALASVPLATLRNYVGTYQAQGGGRGVVALGGDRLTFKLGNQPVTALLPLSATEFEIEGIDAKLVFEAAEGPAAKVIVHQGGREMVATRVP